MFNTKKSGASWAYTPFPDVVQKVLTKKTFHWLEVITVILSFEKYFVWNYLEIN